MTAFVTLSANVKHRRGEQNMTRKLATYGTSKAIRKELYEALRSLFDLLELYSPIWYHKRFHDQAKAALKHSKTCGQVKE